MFLGKGERGLLAAFFVIAIAFQTGCEVKKGSSVHSTATTSPSSTQSKESKSNSDSATQTSSTGPAKTIAAEGSSTVYPICQAFAVEFEKKAKHTVSVGRQGTGGGYKKFVNRQADVWNASRPIDPKEADELKQKGIDWLELNIAVDGIVIAVHAQNNWCSSLTCAQLKQIWEPDSKIHKWSDLNPAWSTEPILLYGADVDSGTFEYFTEVINGKKKATNTKYTPSSDDNVLVQGIANNKMSLGYIPFGYYLENTERLKAISVSPTKDAAEAAAPAVEPTAETILSGDYKPLARPLFMYVSQESLKRPEVKEFMRFVVSKEAQPLIETRLFVRVKEETRQNESKKLETAIDELSKTKSES